MSDVAITYFSECIRSASISPIMGDRVAEEMRFIIEPKRIDPESHWELYDFVYSFIFLQANAEIKVRSALKTLINKLK